MPEESRFNRFRRGAADFMTDLAGGVNSREAEAYGHPEAAGMDMEELRSLLANAPLNETEATALKNPSLKGVRKEVLPYVAPKANGVQTIEVTKELATKFPALSSFVGKMMPSNGILHFMKPSGSLDTEAIKLLAELSDRTQGKNGLINQMSDPEGYQAEKTMLEALTNHIFDRRVPPGKRTPEAPPGKQLPAGKAPAEDVVMMIDPGDGKPKPIPRSKVAEAKKRGARMAK